MSVNGKSRRSVARSALLGVLMLGVAAPGFGLAQPASAQDVTEEGPKGLVIAYRADPSRRADFRRFMISEHAAMLRKLEAEGKLESFRLFYSWYAQPKVWDAMVELRFTGTSQLLAWNRLEQEAPGGLSKAGQALAQPVLTSSVDRVFSNGKQDGPEAERSTYYVIPYEFVSAGEYRDYAKAYVVPQYEGWLKSGLLASYEILFNRYPVGDPWDSFVILQYRDADAFGKRQKILDEVRKGFVNNAVWQAYHKRKSEIRSETENSIADLIAR